jgi:hypothetical protein
MANLTGKDVSFQIDETTSTGAIADISSHLTSAAITGEQNILEDSALGDDERTYLHGLAGATISVAGFWNTTTEAIYGPLIGNRTSRTKTAEYGTFTTNSTSGRYHNGEVLVSNIAVTGAVDTIQVFTADHTFSGIVNRTTVQLS